MLGDNDSGTVCHTAAQGKDQEIQRTGSTYCCQRVCTHILSYDNGIHHIIKLLENISNQ